MPGEKPRSPGFRKPRPLDADALWNYSLKVLSARTLSTGEVRDRLRRRAANERDIEPVMTRLRETGCLNDDRFAEHFAAVRKDSGTFGKVRVLRDLRARKVAPSLAEKAVADAFEGADEEEMIEGFLQRKFRNTDLVQYLQEPKHLRSAYQKLRYAGFGVGSSIRVLKRYAAMAGELEGEEDAS